MHAGLMQAILDDPGSDDRRLVYADWLEENGEGEKSEFIRVQVELAKFSRCPRSHFANEFQGGQCVNCQKLCGPLRRRERELLDRWVEAWLPEAIGAAFGYTTGIGSGHVYFGTERWIDFRRGFVAEITLSCADWCGGRECGRCSGYGERTVWKDEGLRDGLQVLRKTTTARCKDCHGIGRIGGHAGALLAAAPLERVTLADREPADFGHEGQMVFVWDCWGDFGDYRWYVEEPIFRLLKGGRMLRNDPKQLAYSSRQAALDALSAALLTWAKAGAP